MQYKVYLIYHVLDDGSKIPVYAGRTVNKLERRFGEHFSKARNANPKKKLNYFLKHREALRIELHSAFETKEEMFEAEIALIAWLKAEAKANKWRNFNKGKGGEFDRLGMKHSTETRTKMSASQKVAQNKQEVAEAKRASLRDTMNKPEVRARNSDAQKVAQNKPDVRARKSLEMRASHARPEIRKKHIASYNRPDVIAKRIADKIKRFGALYPGAVFLRISKVNPYSGGYKVEPGRGVNPIYGFLTPAAAIPTLLQFCPDIPIPACYVKQADGSYIFIKEPETC